MLLPSKRMRQKRAGKNVKRIVGSRNRMCWMNETLRRNAEENVSLKQNGCQATAFRPLHPKVCQMETAERIPQKENGHPLDQNLVFRAETVSCVAQRLYVYLNTSIYQIAKSPKRKPFLFLVSMNFSLTFILSCFII